MKTAAAYIRVSTDDQTEYSPASQLEKIRMYAAHNGYTLPAEYIFVDEGISGRHTAKRAAFNRMIAAARQSPKPFDAILVWKFSRFARSREDSIVYKSMLRRQCGIDVISVSENIGDDKLSVLMEAMIEAMDEYYSVNLGEEVKRGMTEKVSRGEPVTIPAFGYRIENGRYYPDPTAVPIVQRIYTDFLSGQSMRTIAAALNDCGIRTRRGHLFEQRTVKYILQNPVYIGQLRWTPSGKTDFRQIPPDTRLIKGIHTPIIAADVWQQVQDKLDRMRRPKYQRTADPKKPFILQGLVRCSACGATLTRSANGRSLQCCSYAHGQCKVSHSITIDKLTLFMLDFLQKAGITGDIPLRIRPQKAPAADYSALIRKEERKAGCIQDAFENGVYTLQEYKERRDRITRQIRYLQQQQAIALSPLTDTAAVYFPTQQHIILPLMTALRSPAIAETVKNHLLKSIVERIVFCRRTGLTEIFLSA